MRKQKIFIYAVSAFILFLSCKGKNVAALETPPTCGSSTTYNHFYKVYPGTLSGISSGPASTIWGECIFNSESTVKLYLRNTSTSTMVGSGTSKQYYFLNMNTSNKPGIRKGDSIYVFLRNYSLTSGHIEQNDKADFKAPKHKGSLGCFPGFIVLGDGKIDSFKRNQDVYITLPFAKHVDGKTIYDTLYGYDFKIGSSELRRLNDSIAKYPDLQGGIDKDRSGVLKVYKPDDSLLTCFGE